MYVQVIYEKTSGWTSCWIEVWLQDNGEITCAPREVKGLRPGYRRDQTSGSHILEKSVKGGLQ